MCSKLLCYWNIMEMFTSLHPAKWPWAQGGPMLILHKMTRCAVAAGLKMQWWPQVSQKAEFCRRFYPMLRFPLLVATWQHCSSVGWLCTEECTSNRGGGLWLSQTVSNSFYFLSVILQFSPSFPSGPGPDLDRQYSQCDSVPPQTLVRFTCFL